MTMNNSPFEVNRRILVLYNLYRILLIITLFAIFGVLKAEATHFTNSAFNICAMAYWLSAIASLIYSLKITPGHKASLVMCLIDLILLAILSLVNDGFIHSSIYNLMVVPVLVASVISNIRGSLLIASVAASLVVYGGLLSVPFRNESDYSSIAFTGVVLLFTAIIVQYIAARLRSSEQLRESQARDIINLQQMNQSIIDRMRTGILVCNAQSQIKLSNPAAKRFIANESQLDEALYDLLLRWKDNPVQRFEAVSVNNQLAACAPSFLKFNPDDPQSDILIFLEDSAELTQKAQHLKLASLGRLTASIAHEIRNPLSAINQASQLLHEADYLQLPDIKLLAMIESNSQRINTIINTVLSIGKKDTWQPESIKLNDWLTRFLPMYLAGKEGQQQFEIDIDAAIICRFEPKELEQIICNLLDNGIRYSQELTQSAKLCIAAGIDNESERPWLEVKDYGRGIDDSVLEHLFEPFFTTSETGTGLGLYICQQLCENNQARLTANNWQHGACFRISFAHPNRIIDQL